MRLRLAGAVWLVLCAILSAPDAAFADDATSTPDTVTVCTYQPYDVECTDVAPDAIPPDSFTPTEANLLYARDVLFRDGKFISLSASWNGTPLTDGSSVTLPLTTVGTATWSYAKDDSNPYHHVLQQAPSLEDVLGNAVLTFDVYKGTIGASMLISSQTLTATGTPPIELSFPEAGHYFITYSATYPHGSYPPNMDPALYCLGGGDICPVYRFSLTDFRTFITTGMTNNTENGSGGDYVPAAFGLLQFDVTEASAPHPSPPESVVSNVLFLPGIEGSRLYRDGDCGDESCGVKLWEPLDSLLHLLTGAGNKKVKDLYLDESGRSIRRDVYAKEGDILDTAITSDYYKLFIDEMNGLKTDGTMRDWRAISYDWRLSLPDLLASGAKTANRISYTTATDTPYIEQTLRELAASSKTGKVTIIAHSNGGLVAKALMQKLGDTETARLVDNIILVGVPQSGAPESIGGLLYGYNAGIPFSFSPFIVSAETARGLALNSPMAYHLLPSAKYFEDASDSRHPVAAFLGEAYGKEESAFGQVLQSADALLRFLLGSDEGGVSLNPTLLAYGEQMHDALDAWVPPAGVQLYQIAGWGADTVGGIDFYTAPSFLGALTAAAPTGSYRPIFIEDGDGVVPIPSALMLNADRPNVRDYWLNLAAFNSENNRGHAITHADIFEMPQLESEIENILSSNKRSLPHYLSATQPPDNDIGKKLLFFLHSPLTLELRDTNGNHVGENPDGTFDESIPGASYGEFGDVKYLIAPEGPDYTLTMRGLDTGTFTLDMEEISDGISGTPTIIAHVPTTAQTVATLRIGNGIETASALQVDTNGDGGSDITISPKIDATTIYESARLDIRGGGSSVETRSKPDGIVLGAETVAAPTASVFSGHASSTSSATKNLPGIIVKKQASTKKIKPITQAAIPLAIVAGSHSETTSVHETSSVQSWFSRLKDAFSLFVRDILIKSAAFIGR